MGDEEKYARAHMDAFLEFARRILWREMESLAVDGVDVVMLADMSHEYTGVAAKEALVRLRKAVGDDAVRYG